MCDIIKTMYKGVVNLCNVHSVIKLFKCFKHKKEKYLLKFIWMYTHARENVWNGIFKVLKDCMNMLLVFNAEIFFLLLMGGIEYRFF